MHKARLFILCLITALFSACASYNYITIETLQPSQYTLKAPVQHLTIFNNAFEQDSTQGHTSTKANIFQTKASYYKLSGDTISIDSGTVTCLYNLYNHLTESQIYQSVELIEQRAEPKINSYTSLKLFQQHPSDAFLVLNHLTYADKLTSIYHPSYNYKEYELRVIVKSSWSIYFKELPTRAYSFQVSDTLYWDQSDADREECLYQAIWENGASAAKKLSPHWEKSTRLYYSGNSYIYKQIEKAITQENWKEAATHWKKLYDSSKKESKTKARLAYNMALYFEMENNFETALSWLEIANTMFSSKKAYYESKNALEYAKILQERLNFKKRIDDQWGL